jgi:phosphoribosyl-AMP cyclohydrolase
VADRPQPPLSAARARTPARAAENRGAAIVPGSERIVARIRTEEPDTIGVFVHGSYARGTATPTSDLDLDAVTLGGREPKYRTWFVGELHVSVRIASSDWLRDLRSRESVWSYGFATDQLGEWLWKTAAAVAALGDPPDLSRPPGSPELEDFVEACAKAFRADESLALRLAARRMALNAPALLRDINAPVRVVDQLDAVRAALGFTVAPPGWSDDLSVLLGLAPADDDAVRSAARRLAAGTLALLRRRAPDVDPQPELARYLADGTLERHLGLA